MDAFKYLEEKIEMVKGNIIKDPQLNNSIYAKLAIRDAALLLTYCYQGFDTIVEMDENLDQIFKEIISFLF